MKYGTIFSEFPISAFVLLSKKEINSKNKKIDLVGTLVKKKSFKKAIHRNRIKRLLRASFFLNKYLLEKKIEFSIHKKTYQIIFSYRGFLLPTFEDINQSVKKIFSEILEEKIS